MMVTTIMTKRATLRSEESDGLSGDLGLWTMGGFPCWTLVQLIGCMGASEPSLHIRLHAVAAENSTTADFCSLKRREQ